MFWIVVLILWVYIVTLVVCFLIRCLWFWLCLLYFLLFIVIIVRVVLVLDDVCVIVLLWFIVFGYCDLFCCLFVCCGCLFCLLLCFVLLVLLLVVCLLFVFVLGCGWITDVRCLGLLLLLDCLFSVELGYCLGVNCVIWVGCWLGVVDSFVVWFGCFDICCWWVFGLFGLNYVCFGDLDFWLV